MDTKLCFEAISRSLRHMRRPSIAYCDYVARESLLSMSIPVAETVKLLLSLSIPDANLDESLSKRSQLQCRRSVPFFVNQVGLLNNPRKLGHKLQLILDIRFQLLLRLSNRKLERACVGRSLKLLKL